MSTSNFLSICTVTTIGLACKAFLNLGFCSSVTVSGMHHLMHALQDNERSKGKGIVTGASLLSCAVHQLRGKIEIILTPNFLFFCLFLLSF